MTKRPHLSKAQRGVWLLASLRRPWRVGNLGRRCSGSIAKAFSPRMDKSGKPNPKWNAIVARSHDVCPDRERREMRAPARGVAVRDCEASPCRHAVASFRRGSGSAPAGARPRQGECVRKLGAAPLPSLCLAACLPTGASPSRSGYSGCYRRLLPHRQRIRLRAEAGAITAASKPYSVS